MPLISIKVVYWFGLQQSSDCPSERSQQSSSSSSTSSASHVSYPTARKICMEAVWEDWRLGCIKDLTTSGHKHDTGGGCFSGNLRIDPENLHHCLWFRSAVQRRWSVPNRIPVGFLSSFSQGCSTLSTQRWQSRIPKPERGTLVSAAVFLPAFTQVHTHTASLIYRHTSPQQPDIQTYPSAPAGLFWGIWSWVR